MPPVEIELDQISSNVMSCRTEDGVSKEKNILLLDDLTMVSSYSQIFPPRSKKGKHTEMLAHVELTRSRFGL